MPYKSIKVNGRKIDLHRHLMQVHLGRTLDRFEVVHHIDGDTLNNDISNLQVMSLSDHTKLHRKTQPARVMTQELKQRLKDASIANCPSKKLTEDNVRQVRKMLNDGIRVYEIAERFNVSRKAIYLIKHGEHYAWVK